MLALAGLTRNEHLWTDITCIHHCVVCVCVCYWGDWVCIRMVCTWVVCTCWNYWNWIVKVIYENWI